MYTGAKAEMETLEEQYLEKEYTPPCAVVPSLEGPAEAPLKQKKQCGKYMPFKVVAMLL